MEARMSRYEKEKHTIRAYNRTPRGRYAQHRANAKNRGVEWQLTFEDWWAVWEPHWDQRGPHANGAIMCRIQEPGPYSPDNVRIGTKSQNTQQWWDNRRNNG
jgi:hypothetical protein